jgi:hypothetical protein
MRKFLCQVCGGASDENEQGRLWLLRDYRGVDGWPEREVTTHPPVCLPCAPLAARLCPHLRDKVVAVRAGLDGADGKVYERGRRPLPVLAEEQTVFTIDWRVRWTVGAHLAAALMDITVVNVPGPRRVICTTYESRAGDRNLGAHDDLLGLSQHSSRATDATH